VNRPLVIALAVSASALAGCAHVQPREAFPEVSKTVNERTGGKPVWNSGTAEDAAAENAVRDLLSHPLTADSATQIALLGNHNVQATYEELGIAQADLVQAGLLTNPVVDALLRFPDGGRGGTNFEISVSQNFISLLSLPLRKKVAAAQYAAAKARVAGQIIDLTADVREAYYTLQGAQQMVELQQSIADATAASAEAAQRLREAGNITELQLAGEQALHAQAVLDLATAKAEVTKDREKLTALLGLSSPDAIKLADRLPDLPAAETGLDDVASLALRQRQDFGAAVAEVNSTYASLGLTQRYAWLSGAEVYADAEHELDGGWVAGPGVTVPVPIFDTGAAAVSGASGRVRQARQRLLALQTQIASDARAAKADLLVARDRAEYCRNTLLPLRQKITQQTQLQYNGMLMSVFQLLQAKRDEVDAARSYVLALRDYWTARTRLERAVGGRLPTAATSQPNSTTLPTVGH